MNQFDLRFDVSGTATQGITIIDGDYDSDDIIAGLDSGELATTTWFGDGKQQIQIVATGEAVANIDYQEIDGEYINFG